MCPGLQRALQDPRGRGGPEGLPAGVCLENHPRQGGTGQVPGRRLCSGGSVGRLPLPQTGHLLSWRPALCGPCPAPWVYRESDWNTCPDPTRGKDPLMLGKPPASGPPCGAAVGPEHARVRSLTVQQSPQLRARRGAGRLLDGSVAVTL